MKKSLFLFRQDLRTFDNIGLIECIKNSDEILPIFILDKNIVGNFGGLQDKKFGFVREMLENLDNEIQKISNTRLLVVHDFPENIIPKLIQTYSITDLYLNRTYSRYGKKRDEILQKYCHQNNIGFHQFKDYLIVEPEEVEQRKVFTPFYKLWQKQLGEITLCSPKNFKGIKLQDFTESKDFIPVEKHPFFTYDFGQKRLKENIKTNYEDFRNNLDKDGTSKLSPYLRFGVFSVRELYQKGSISSNFLSELAWREFWQHIDYFFPETKNREFQENKRHIKWEKDNFLFQKWCEGKTGYPIVDACMKQLIETNRMHGRGRMIVASFLTKDLHIDWRLGEEFFKKHLLDYDENVNFGNWQWSASVGADPKPLRIFNPILQSEKFDPNAVFIKKYLPELSNENIKAIHNPLENSLDYIRVIVDHREEQKRARLHYKGEKL